MNAQNARSIGFEDGKTFIRGFMETTKGPFSVEKPFFTDAHKAVVLSNAHNRATYTYRVKSQRTADFYVQGVTEAWYACEQEYQQAQAEVARKAAIQHNPASRFCMCVECMKGE